MKTRKLTLESFKYYVKNIIKEEIEKSYKAYKNSSTFELQAYIIELNKEIQAHKSRGDNKKAELAMKDLEEVKAELASRKKTK